VSLYYLHNFALARILYLPFAPEQVSVTTFQGRSFLLVVGEVYDGDKNMQQQQAVAICLDVSAPIALSPYELMMKKHNRSVHGEGVGVLTTSATARSSSSGKEIDYEIVARNSCRRFQIVPILLPALSEDFIIVLASEYCATSGTDSVAYTSPALVMLIKQKEKLVAMQRTFQALTLVPRRELASSPHKTLIQQLRGENYKMDKGQMIVIATEHAVADTACIPLLPIEARLVGDEGTRRLRDSTLWCHVGQGWCLVGFGMSLRCFFICWEGSTEAYGAFVAEFMVSSKHPLDESRRTIVAPILPLPSSRANAGRLDLPALPFLGNSRRSEVFRGFQQQNQLTRMARLNSSTASSYSDTNANDGLLDDVVVEAIQSILSQNYRETIVATSPPRSPRRLLTAYTPTEKSERLLKQCSSWTELQTSANSHAYFQLQVPVLIVRFSSARHWMLSLRKVVVDNGSATPFQQVLSWMSESGDYFAAASVALDLLRDAASLRFLWVALEKIDDEDERAKLEGLLDGIVPIYGDVVEKATMTHLADMTVGCLTKGGFAMASTLEYFLEFDVNYDTSRACLMLVATAANVVSDDEDTVLEIMGKGYEKDENHAKNILWPVRCLLKAAVARGKLLTALLLLNSTIPDEMRHRNRSGIAASSMPSLDLCKSLVSLIIASSPEAAELLLSLVDEQSRAPFWESLDHETQLELSLIMIRDKAPLLRQIDVRSWALDQLQKQIDLESSFIRTGSSAADILPTDWLKRLCMACLANAECYLERFRKPPSPFDSTALEHNSPQLIEQHGVEIYRIRDALTPARGSGGLDVDLLIPALLILRRRDIGWNESLSTTTQSFLNAACFLAGRTSVEEPMFNVDSATLMRQCTLVNDVQAGANLVGGTNCLILACCDVLMCHAGLSMEEAEAFLLEEPMRVDQTRGNGEISEGFVLHSGRIHILWLLDEHVLAGVKTYGDLETIGSVRGKVDPVFSARTCLRTWWRLSKEDRTDTESTAWLTDWLEHKLEMSTSVGSDSPGKASPTKKTSPRRLACAALARALIWPESTATANSNGPESILAARLDMPNRFLVALTRSCCGLVESLPPHEAEKAWRGGGGGRATFGMTDPSLRQIDQKDSVDESFASSTVSLLSE